MRIVVHHGEKLLLTSGFCDFRKVKASGPLRPGGVGPVMWSRFLAWLVHFCGEVLGFSEAPLLPSLPPPPSDMDLADEYVRAGLEFGEAVSFLHLGECDGFEGLLDAWSRAEAVYAERGFRTLPLDAFVEAASREDCPLEGLLNLRSDGEAPAFHAPYYRANFLGKVPEIDLDTYLRSEMTPSRFTLPSTLHLTQRPKVPS